MSQFDVCVQAMQGVGCQVTVEADSVKVRFPADPNDPGAAPDGEERQYNKAYFTLLITRTWLGLIEEHIISSDGEPLCPT